MSINYKTYSALKLSKIINFIRFNMTTNYEKLTPYKTHSALKMQ